MQSVSLISCPIQITISPYSSKCTTQFQLNPIKIINPTIPQPLSLSLKSCTTTPTTTTQSPLSKKPYNYDYTTTTPPTTKIRSPNSVAHKLQVLVANFKSLTQPIDRVKRLLDYATRLPYFEESARSEENRVSGCTAQLWVEVKMDVEGLMRFKVESDSEITKGFCSCLIWLLDGASPEEVVAVKAEDLAEINVGILPANSRVNTWNTVLLSMQKRSKALAVERYGHHISSSFLAAID